LSDSLLLRGARQLLTLRGDPCVRRGPQSSNLEVIEDGSVFIQGGKIVAVGPTRRLENLKETRGAIEIPAHQCVVMPGFVDASMQLSLLTPQGLNGTPRRRRKLRDFFNESLTLMRSCMLHGTLNAAIRARSGIHSMGADLSVLRQLARIGNNPVGLTRIWCPECDLEHPIHEDHWPGGKAWQAAWDTIAKGKLADCVSLHCDNPFIQLDNQRSMKVILDWLGGSADDLNRLLHQSAPTGVFCQHDLSAEECDVLAASKTTAVFAAGAGLIDGSPDRSVRNLIDGGGAVALGSGYDSLDEQNFNMQLVLALAVRRLNLTIEEAIVATTINAAYAMNCGHEIGSLEPGKRADLLILSLNDYREIPRRLGINHLAMAIRGGEITANRTKWKVGAA
jgi:imidazolonepropionase